MTPRRRRGAPAEVWVDVGSYRSNDLEPPITLRSLLTACPFPARALGPGESGPAALAAHDDDRHVDVGRRQPVRCRAGRRDRGGPTRGQGVPLVPQQNGQPVFREPTYG